MVAAVRLFFLELLRDTNHLLVETGNTLSSRPRRYPFQVYMILLIMTALVSTGFEFQCSRQDEL